jgi:hypothetical protein
MAWAENSLPKSGTKLALYKIKQHTQLHNPPLPPNPSGASQKGFLIHTGQ